MVQIKSRLDHNCLEDSWRLLLSNSDPQFRL